MDVNPVLPAGFEILGWVFAAAYVGFLLWALVTLAMSRSATAGTRIAWLAFIVIVPVIGSAAWLAFRLTRRAAQQATRE